MSVFDSFFFLFLSFFFFQYILGCLLNCVALSAIYLFLLLFCFVFVVVLFCFVLKQTALLIKWQNKSPSPGLQTCYVCPSSTFFNLNVPTELYWRSLHAVSCVHVMLCRLRDLQKCYLLCLFAFLCFIVFFFLCFCFSLSFSLCASLSLSLSLSLCVCVCVCFGCCCFFTLFFSLLSTF